MRSHVAARLFLLTTLVAASPAPEARADAGALARGLAAAAATDWNAAEGALREAAAGPDRARALSALARVELATGRAADAASHAAEALRLAPAASANGDASVVLAEALTRQGKRAEAMSALAAPAAAGSLRANVALGELLIDAGRRGDARAPLLAVVEAYNDGRVTDRDAEGLALVGRAAALLRSARDANDAFSQAERAGKGAPPRVETLLFRGDLFLEKYDPGHAGEVMKEAKQAAPNDARVLVLEARVRLENSMDFAGAERAVEAALAIDPTLPSAQFVKAGLALRVLDIDAADRAVAAGLAACPGDLDLLAMAATIRFLADDEPGFARARAAFFARNAESTRLFQVLAEYADWEHRYDDIVRFLREATKLDPADARAFADLGLNLIRIGEEDAGLEALRAAWKKDRYNVRVYNTLNLYEKEIPSAYETTSHGPFRIRWPKDEAKILARYVPAMLDEAWKAMVARYGVTPRGPIFIELYASREHFSIRTAGLPRVGIEGVCFGRTVAAMTPRGEPSNWGNVLWHELAHVFAIQLSDSRVPRWFTEGLSEWETIVQRPEWQREEDPALWAALRGGRLPTFARMNRAFTHVDDVRDVVAAYYASSQAQLYFAERFGTPKVVTALRLFGRKLRAREALETAFGVPEAELDRGFRAWLAARLSRYATQLVPDLHAPPLDEARANAAKDPGARAQVELAVALLAARKPDDATAAVEAALAADPIDGEASYVKARLFRARGDAAAARDELHRAIGMGLDGYATRVQLAEIAGGAGDKDGARKNLEIARAWDPSMADPLRALLALARKDKRADDELSLLRALAALDQHDRALHVSLLEALVSRGLWADARREGEVALFVDPESAKIHLAFARALAHTGDRARAAFELESAALCDAPPAELEAARADVAAAR